MRQAGGGTDLRDIFQLAYVTTDFEEALRVLSSRVGMSRFGRLGEFPMETPTGGVLRAEVGLAWAGGIQLEVIEPRGGDDGLYRDPLPADGSFALQFHHVGVLVASLEDLEQRRANSQGAGMSIVLSGAREGQSSFFYADAREALGHYLEYLYFTPERLAFHRAQPRN